MIALARPETLGSIAARVGATLRGLGGGDAVIARLASVDVAGEGDLAPVLGPRGVAAAEIAAARGAALLVDGALAERRELRAARAICVHAHATWALAELLDGCAAAAVVADARDAADELAAARRSELRGAGVVVAPGAVVGPRVVLGARVRIGAGAVVGAAGFGWAFGPGGRVRAVPQLGGVVVEDDVAIGPLSTVDAGTLGPTVLRRGVKLDAHVHVGHNCDIGEGTIVAAQSGFAGSVRVGRGVLVGGQVGVADHVTIGDGARIAAKSGVIGDVPAGAVVAGYPAVARARWLRGLASLYRGRGRAPRAAPSLR